MRNRIMISNNSLGIRISIIGEKDENGFIKLTKKDVRYIVKTFLKECWEEIFMKILI